MTELKIEDMINDETLGINFEIVAGHKGLDRKIVTTDINRPGLALAGYFTFFGARRIQLLGKGEIAYLEHLDTWSRREILEKIFEFDIPCFVVAWGMEVHSDLIELANKCQVPVLRTELSTGVLTTLLTLYLQRIFAPEENISGGLVDVYGVGVLIVGESGIGKSECELDLIERGHRLVADDVVKVKRIGNVLVGTSPDLIRYHMEVRGLGVINVKEIFGISAVCHHKDIDLIVRMETWEKTDNIDRLGLEEMSEEILGVKLPLVIIPVKPGRNISVIVEVAAMTQRLKKMGHHPVVELDKRITEEIQRREEVVRR
jgi:HPr kinase/phosphorylase